MKRVTISLFVVVLTILSGSSALAWGGSSARIRVVHAVPDAAGVYVSVNNNIVLGHVYYGDVSAYVPVPSGTNNVKIITANQAQTVLVDTSFIMEQDASYTIEVSGAQDNVTWLKLDDNSKLPEYGMANLQSSCCYYNRPQYYPQIRYFRPGPNYYYFRGNTPGWPGWGW